MGTGDIFMPRNYIASDAYPIQVAPEVHKLISNGKKKIEEAAEILKNGRKLKKRYVFLFEYLIVKPVAIFWGKFVLTAKAFYVKDSCIGCGKCSRLCPLDNIQIQDKKPVW